MSEEILISENEKPIWQLVVASFLYATLFYAIFRIGFLFYTNGFTENIYHLAIGVFEMSGFILVSAFGFSVRTLYLFDFKNNKYKKIYRVGFIKIGFWQKLPKLDYISVFDAIHVYKVNLWYVKNKYFTLYIFDDKEDALFAGNKIAESLNLKILDATDRNKINTWLN